MENCLPALRLRVALPVGALDAPLADVSAAWLDGWQAARAARLKPVIRLVQYFGLMMCSVVGEILEGVIGRKTAGRYRTTR